MEPQIGVMDFGSAQCLGGHTTMYGAGIVVAEGEPARAGDIVVLDSEVRGFCVIGRLEAYRSTKAGDQVGIVRPLFGGRAIHFSENCGEEVLPIVDFHWRQLGDPAAPRVWAGRDEEFFINHATAFDPPLPLNKSRVASERKEAALRAGKQQPSRKGKPKPKSKPPAVTPLRAGKQKAPARKAGMARAAA